jgi:uncharacterized protein (TIGR03118 family)
MSAAVTTESRRMFRSNESCGARRCAIHLRARFTARLESLDQRRLFSMASAVVQTNLVSDDTQFTPAQVQDANLVNPWGLAASPGGAWWVANQGTGTSTLYNSSQAQVSVESLVVGVPSAQGRPTAEVFNNGGPGTFDLVPNNNSTSSVFLFASTNGTISGWNPNAGPTNTVVGASKAGALYLGLAIATDSSGAPRLYAADFAHNTIDVYDRNFQLLTNLSGNFEDSHLPDNYHAFNVQTINHQLYVEYAPIDKILTGAADQGDGAVDVYNADGQLKQRLIRHGHLTQPWAIAMAPSNFGSFSNDLLVGNFGDGHINAFDPKNGHFDGQLKDDNGQPITITHLWGLAFGNGVAAGATNTLYFTAGLTSHLAPSDATFHGLFGSLQIASGQARASALGVSAPAMPSSMMSAVLTGVLELDSTSTIDVLGE